MVSFRNLKPGFVYKINANNIHSDIIFRVVKRFHQDDYCVILLGDNSTSILGVVDCIAQYENTIHIIEDNNYIPKRTETLVKVHRYIMERMRNNIHIPNDAHCPENTNPIEGGKIKKILNKSVDKKSVNKKSVDKKSIDKKSVDKKSVDKKNNISLSIF